MESSSWRSGLGVMLYHRENDGRCSLTKLGKKYRAAGKYHPKAILQGLKAVQAEPLQRELMFRP
jgi:hypothetical protein